MKTTISRRQALASIPAVALTPAAASHDGTSAQAADDPVFAAIERHRQAAQAWRTASAAASADGYDRAAEAARDAAYDRAGDAFENWVTTQPTTMAGVLATLDYAASPSPLDDDRTVLTYGDLPLDRCSDFEPAKFLAMIAAALRRLTDNQL
jgi:hypothetical protein